MRTTTNRLRRALLCVLAFAAFLSTTLLQQPSAGAQEEDIQVLIIGDSFSAGTGARTEDGDRSYYGTEECYRSTETWGEFTAAKIGEQLGRSVNVNNRACHGGLAEHIAERNDSGVVEPGEFKKNTVEHKFRTHGSHSSAEEWCTQKGSTGPDDFWKGDARESSIPGRWVPVCTRYVRSPLDQVTTSTDYVLMTVGGNDAGFGKIGQRCLALDIAGQGRKGDQCGDALDEAFDRLSDGTFTDRIDAVVSAVHSRLNPEGRQEPGTIVLNSYPYLLRNHDYTFAERDVGADLKELQDLGDAAQREVMSRYNTRTEGECRVLTSLFADGTKGEFGDHGVSAPINTNGSDDWWLWEVVIVGAKGESLHPKRAGYEAMSRSGFSALEQGGLGGCYVGGFLAGDLDNFGYGNSALPCDFYDLSGPEDLGVFDRELTDKHEVDTWDHDFSAELPSGFDVARVTIEVHEAFSDDNSSTISFDGVERQFVGSNQPAKCGTALRTFVLEGADAAIASDGRFEIVFSENGDDVALDYSRVWLESTDGRVVGAGEFHTARAGMANARTTAASDANVSQLTESPATP